MAATTSGARSELQLHSQRRCNKQREITSPENLSTNNSDINTERRVVVPVVYYLSRNGQLDHPHFIEVPLSSPHGLFLRDVINRLNLLRGKGLASNYSWSSKRSYKNGYVWHDLQENDFIHPVHGGEYVLKGSEILEALTISKSPETASSSSAKNTPDNAKNSDDDSGFPEVARGPPRRRNQSWGGGTDLSEYKVYKAESTHEFTAADASTQTEDKRRRNRKAAVIKEEVEGEQSTELSREEISPPPSDSSPETLETLMKADPRLMLASSSLSSQPINQADKSDASNRTAGYYPSTGRIKASSVLMSLISCGSISFRDWGATAVKDHGLSLISSRVPRGENQTAVMMEIEKKATSSFAKMALEDKEYFSGSLIETKKDEFPAALKRSSSYNADRNMKLEEKEVERVRARCIPRKPKAPFSNVTHHH